MTLSSRSPGRAKNGLAPSGYPRVGASSGDSGTLPEPRLQLTRHLLISGRVQGVWYRESMRQEAERLGVTGWVRNCADGTVEAVVQGDESAVAAIIAWTRSGPPAARVADVAITPAEGMFTTFARLPSV